MEKIIVGKWYRHRGNKNSVPERVKNASKNYDVIVRYRGYGSKLYSLSVVMHPVVWRHLAYQDRLDIMAYKFVEKK